MYGKTVRTTLHGGRWKESLTTGDWDGWLNHLQAFLLFTAYRFIIVIHFLLTSYISSLSPFQSGLETVWRCGNYNWPHIAYWLYYDPYTTNIGSPLFRRCHLLQGMSQHYVTVTQRRGAYPTSTTFHCPFRFHRLSLPSPFTQILLYYSTPVSLYHAPWLPNGRGQGNTLDWFGICFAISAMCSITPGGEHCDWREIDYDLKLLNFPRPAALAAKHFHVTPHCLCNVKKCGE